MKILLVGDEIRMRRLCSFGLVTKADRVSIVNSLTEPGRLCGLHDHEVAVLDWDMRDGDGASLLAQLRRLAPALPVVVFADRDARGDEAVVGGAAHVLLKPIDVADARAILLSCARPVASPAGEAAASFKPLPTCSPVLRRQLAIAARIAPTPVNVLLLGENGTGKTCLARSIHAQSERRDRAFVTVSCLCPQAQVPLLESELFGHVRGAFTGAVADFAGLVAAAEGGTLFFDEVGELPPALQPRLLRLLRERCYGRVGETRLRPADIRILAATSRDLRAEVAAGRFCEDLFHRLKVVTLEMPSLRERPGDILPTAEHLLAGLARETGRAFRGFSAGARAVLLRHSWPGNLRELRNCVERAAATLCDNEAVEPDDLPDLGEGLHAAVTGWRAGSAAFSATLQP